MSIVLNDRDVLLQNAPGRYAGPPNYGVLLSPSASIFEVSTSNTPSPSSITLTASVLGRPSAVVAFTASKGATLSVAGNVATLAFANMPTNATTVTASFQIDGFTYTATQAIGKAPGFDMSVPPAPTGLAAASKLASVDLAWTAPNFANLAYTEVWSSTTSVLANATLIGRAGGRVYNDFIGSSATRYYWIRFISKTDVVGPFNSPTGTVGSTSIDPAYMLQVLAGKITESQLYTALGTRINLIDGPAQTAGTVANRISTERLRVF